MQKLLMYLLICSSIAIKSMDQITLLSPTDSPESIIEKTMKPIYDFIILSHVIEREAQIDIFSPRYTYTVSIKNNLVDVSKKIISRNQRKSLLENNNRQVEVYYQVTEQQFIEKNLHPYMQSIIGQDQQDKEYFNYNINVENNTFKTTKNKIKPTDTCNFNNENLNTINYLKKNNLSHSKILSDEVLEFIQQTGIQANNLINNIVENSEEYNLLVNYIEGKNQTLIEKGIDSKALMYFFADHNLFSSHNNAIRFISKILQKRERAEALIERLADNDDLD